MSALTFSGRVLLLIVVVLTAIGVDDLNRREKLKKAALLMLNKLPLIRYILC